jgi:hypothetical protein
MIMATKEDNKSRNIMLFVVAIISATTLVATFDELIKDSKEWVVTDFIICVLGAGLFGLIVIVRTIKKKQFPVIAWLPFLTAIAYFVIVIHYSTPDYYFKSNKKKWLKNGSELSMYDLDRIFTSSEQGREMLANKEASDFFQKRLDLAFIEGENEKNGNETNKYMAILALQSLDKQNIGVDKIILQPYGYRILLALLTNEVSPIYLPKYSKEGKIAWGDLNLTPDLKQNFQFGLIKKQQLEQLIDFCITNPQKLSMAEYELLFYLLTKIPYNIPEKDFDKLTQKWVNIKPFYREEIRKSIKTRQNLHQFIQNKGKSDTTALRCNVINTMKEFAGDDYSLKYIKPLVCLAGYNSYRPKSGVYDLTFKIDTKVTYYEKPKSDTIPEVLPRVELIIKIVENGYEVEIFRGYEKLAYKYLNEKTKHFDADLEALERGEVWLMGLSEQLMK